MITSRSNPTFKQLRRLRDNRSRRAAGEILTDGWRQTDLALASGRDPIALYVDDVGCHAAVGRGVDASRLTLMSRELLRSAAYGDVDVEVIGRFDWSVPALSIDALPDRPRVLVADRMEKPGNIGAVLRCVDAVGFDALVLCGGGDPSHPHAVRNSQGAVFTVPISRTDDDAAATRLFHDADVSVYAARVEGATPMQAVDWGDGGVAIVVGNEADGLGDRWGGAGVRPVAIEMRGGVDSLNVSVSAALLMYQVPVR